MFPQAKVAMVFMVFMPNKPFRVFLLSQQTHRKQGYGCFTFLQFPKKFM